MASEGKMIASSQELVARLPLTAAQIRKDPSCFGEFGKQDKGYEIGHLEAKLRQILQVDRTWPVDLVGAGD